MRRFAAYLFLAAGVGLFVGADLTRADDNDGNAPADRKERAERGRREGPPRGRRGPGGPGHHGPPPIIAALDIDKDGVISASEIEGAVAALKSLDKNSDGDLTMEELRPEPPAEGGPGVSRRGGNREGRFGRGPGDRGDNRGRADRGERPSPEEFVARIMQSDKDGNGEISKEEAPERLSRGFDRIDKDENGSLTKAELEEASKRFG
jgi:Ca2+-binding EF-hand superfamily protein